MDPLAALIGRWKLDPGGTYRSWFLWDQRLKNFRAIRAGVAVAEVVREIGAGTVGNVYKGSSLETVVRHIAEQRQLFRCADHAFLWKPKLRIPDIYENAENQRSFGRFLDARDPPSRAWRISRFASCPTASWRRTELRWLASARESRPSRRWLARSPDFST